MYYLQTWSNLFNALKSNISRMLTNENLLVIENHALAIQVNVLGSQA